MVSKQIFFNKYSLISRDQFEHKLIKFMNKYWFIIMKGDDGFDSCGNRTLDFRDFASLYFFATKDCTEITVGRNNKNILFINGISCDGVIYMEFKPISKKGIRVLESSKDDWEVVSKKVWRSRTFTDKFEYGFIID